MSGGENVYPAEVERVLRDHPAVADVAVIGVPHPRWVETPVAFVVPADGQPAPTESELVAHCRERLAGYKKPSAIYFVDALPRNATGKVVKRSCATDHVATKLNSCHNAGGRARTPAPFRHRGGGATLSSLPLRASGPGPLVLDSRLLVP